MTEQQWEKRQGILSRRITRRYGVTGASSKKSLWEALIHIQDNCECESKLANARITLLKSLLRDAHYALNDLQLTYEGRVAVLNKIAETIDPFSSRIAVNNECTEVIESR